MCAKVQKPVSNNLALPWYKHTLDDRHSFIYKILFCSDSAVWKPIIGKKTSKTNNKLVENISLRKQEKTI